MAFPRPCLRRVETRNRISSRPCRERSTPAEDWKGEHAKEQLWEEYQSKLKASYLEQLQIYDNDMKKLDAEISQVKTQKEEAIGNVTALAEAGEAPVHMQVELPKTATTEQEDAWKKLLATKPWEIDEDPWASPTGGGTSSGANPRTLREIQESHDARDDLFRAKLRTMQQEILDLKCKSAATDTVLQAVCTPERRPRTGLSITPPPTMRQPTSGKGDAEAGGSRKCRRVEIVQSAPSPECYMGGKGNVIKDPYLVSPSSTSRPAIMDPAESVPFGPMRSAKRAGISQVEGPTSRPVHDGTAASAAGGICKKPPPQIVNDDGEDEELPDEAPSDGSNDLSLME